MLLVLVRHGHGPHVGKRLPTPASPLSAAGRQEADALVQRFEGMRIDGIVTSPMQRAKDTAAPLAHARSIRPRTKAALGDVRYGTLGGKSLKTLMSGDLPRKLALWPSDVRFPRGETLRETQQRAVQAIEELREVYDRNHVVAVFSHGDPIRLIVAHYLGVHIDLFRRIAVDPVGVSAIDLRGGMPQVRVVNEHGPLRALAPEGS